MRIDGFSPAYVPNRTTRPDAVSVAEDVARQDESRNRQANNLSQSARPQTLQAVSQLQAQEEYQRYQERQASIPRQLPWQNQQALSSYASTAYMVDELPKDAAQVLGLDLYA